MKAWIVFKELKKYFKPIEIYDELHEGYKCKKGCIVKLCEIKVIK